MSNILLYERPFSSRLFRAVIEGVHPGSKVLGISSYRGCSDIWSGDYLYDANYDGCDDRLAGMIDDIICRDRSLSLMERERAMRLVARFWNGAEALFRKEHFTHFYTISVDCYEIDILLRLGQLYGVIPVSWIGTFLHGYARITLRGERVPLGRCVPPNEVEAIKNQLLEKAYLPASETKNVQKKGSDALKFFLRRWLVEKVYYPAQKLRYHDPDNLMYNTQTFSAMRYSDIYQSNYDERFIPLDSLHLDRAKTVYYPMHLIPEATTSYWCKDVIRPNQGGNVSSYAQFVKRFISEADDDIHFLIKEHPAMFGRRPLSFYDELNALPNVDVIHPMVRSNDLLGLVDNVLVDDGTVGVEALLRGKRVISLEDNYYSALHPNISVVERVSADALASQLQSYEPAKFVEALLSDTFISDYANGKQQGQCAVGPIVGGVKMYLAALGENV